MSYADAEVDFSDVGVACLAGANGAGKSALLDAVTWAIWEKGRASSDELIAIGEKEMWVDVRFEHEDKDYRIRRARSKPRTAGKSTSKGQLELQVLQSGASLKIPVMVLGKKDDNQEASALADPTARALTSSNGSWRSLTGSSIKDTQRLIVQLLRMDFDTFVNSAYLRQGRADEFTTRLPTDRKQILSEILGLSYFDRLQERCKEYVRILRRDREILEQLLAKLPESESLIDRLRVEADTVGAALASAEIEKADWQKEVALVAERHRSLLLNQENLTLSTTQLTEQKQDVESLTEEVNTQKARLAELERVLASQPSIEEDLKKYESLRTVVERLDQDALTDQFLRNKKVDARSQLADVRNKLDLEYGNILEKLEQLNAAYTKLSLDTTDSAVLRERYEEFRLLQQREALLSQKQENFAQLSQRITHLQSAIDAERLRLELEAEQKRALIIEADQLLSGKEALNNHERELEEKTKRFEKLEAELELTEQTGTGLKARKESITQQIAGLSRIVAEQQAKIEELEAHSHSSICPLCSAPILDRAAVIARYRQSIGERTSETNSLNMEIDRIEIDLQAHRKEYLRLKKILDGRKDLDQERGQFRERQIALERAVAHRDQVKREAEALLERLRIDDYCPTERDSLQALQDQLRALDFDPVTYASLQAQLRAQRSIEGRYQQMLRDTSELKEIAEALPGLSARAENLKADLAEESYGQEIRSQLSDLDDQLKSLAYDRHSHAEAKKALSMLLPVADKHRELKYAFAEKPRLSAALANSELRLAAKKQQHEALIARSNKWEIELKELPNIKDKLETAEINLETVRQRYEENARQLAVLAAKISDTELDLANLKAKLNESKNLKQRIDDYAFLADAFGKRGIQAIIIENAIPEIETDANRILSRLSENQMHVKLETQQKNKSGTVVETLDILIADMVGTRSYELYSGGEAFKVNFALRVALSRLLARRAGAKLETLIIDEGFGSQDELSRDRLVKAIRAIQSDFEKILVITHFADVKEMFPTHLLVSKIDGHSQVQLLR
jgi:exonuclease SbcC